MEATYLVKICENMRGLYAHDSIMKFDGQFVKFKADQAGIKQFKYTGTRIDTTRNFCARTMGEFSPKKKPIVYGKIRVERKVGE